MMISGCGAGSKKPDYSSLDLAPVTGTVKLDGKPVAGATVVFESEDKRFSEGKTDENGYYTLMYDSNQAGVTPGEKTVRITAGAAEGSDGEESGGEDNMGRPLKAKVKIPAKFNKKSELKRTVEAGGSAQTFDFDLKS